MNIRKILLFLPLLSLISACTIVFPSGSGDSEVPSGPDDPGGDDPTEITKQTLSYKYSDLMKNHYYTNISYMPSTGEVNYLVIPVWLTDSNNYYNLANINEYTTIINKAFFGEDEEVGWKSVKNYYETLSNGELTINGEVANCYNASYSTLDISQEITKQIAKNAVQDWKSHKTQEEIKSYDSDHNGYLDAVSIIYLAPYYTSTVYSGYPQSQNTDLWAFVYWVQDASLKSTSNPGVNDYMWASFDFLKQKNNLPIDTHTVIHETGHLFGLEDYYDYSEENYCYAGGFSMQDLNVGSHDPWSVMALGWAKPYVPTTSVEITIGTFQSTRDLILLSPDFDNSPFDEFILLELYSPTGLNENDTMYEYDSLRVRGPVNIGLRVWHVDARIYYSIGQNKTITNKILPGYHYRLCNTNTYPTQKAIDEGRVSSIEEMRDYRLLNLIRRNDVEANKNKSYISSSDLFTSYSSFSTAQYQGYFINDGKLNNGLNLGFSFLVKSIDYISSSATIQITKL